MPYGSQFSNRKLWKNPPRTRCGLKGVLYFPRCKSGPWKAYYRHHGQYVCIGYFPTKEEAARAYNLAVMKAYGREAYFNPIRPDCESGTGEFPR